eukprot:TRINITY_DN1309_c0_g1_i1.p1 TRINITY_DN1309_c0_g1~~TRINITY_DN1309_c0_g1_i1.p1  ORF type:complete len:225 (-),score=40.93 TRINITY_DN1309_c0_g1_i1:2376-3050(-)
MTLRISFIRHGQSEANTKDLAGQSINSNLSKRGILEAQLLGNYLLKNGTKYDYVFSSTAIRAMETARISCEISKQNVEIVTSPDILEIHRGDLDGKPLKNLYEPKYMVERSKDPYNYRFPGDFSESFADVEVRVVKFVNNVLIPLQKTALLDDGSGRKEFNIAVYSHGVAIRCFLKYLLNADPDLLHFIPANTGVTQVSYSSQGKWAIHSINEIPHLMTSSLDD